MSAALRVSPEGAQPLKGPKSSSGPFAQFILNP